MKSIILVQNIFCVDFCVPITCVRANCICTCAHVTISSYLQSLFRPNTHSGLLYKHKPHLDLHINCKVQQKFEWSVYDFCLYASLIFYFQGPDGLLMFVTVQSGVTNFHDI